MKKHIFCFLQLLLFITYTQSAHQLTIKGQQNSSSARQRISPFEVAHQFQELFPHLAIRQITRKKPAKVENLKVPTHTKQTPSPPTDPLEEIIKQKFEMALNDRANHEHTLRLLGEANRQTRQAFDVFDKKEEYQRRMARAEALHKTVAYERTSTRTFHLNEKTIEKLEELGVDAAEMRTITGNAFQQTMQSEFCQLVAFATNEQWWKAENATQAFLAQNIINFSDIGSLLNRHVNDALKTITIADTCWALKEVLVGGALGIGDALINIKEVALHPIEAGKRTLHGLQQLPTVVKKAANLIAKVADTCLSFATISIAQYIAVEIAHKETNKVRVNLIEFTNAFRSLRSVPPRELIRHGTSTAIEMYAMGKALAAVGKFYQGAKVHAIKLLDKAKKSGTATEVVAAVEGVPVYLAQESIECLAAEAQGFGKLKVFPSAAQIEEAFRIEQEAHAIWNNSKELQKLTEQVKKLKGISEPKLFLACDIVMPEMKKYRKAELWAEAYYKAVRQVSTDIMLISKNTGIHPSLIKKIKNHLFVDTHILYEGIQQFGALPDIASAWSRLMCGKYAQQDLILLLHEYAEALIMHNRRLPYEIAHPICSKKYPWEFIIDGKGIDPWRSI